MKKKIKTKDSLKLEADITAEYRYEIMCKVLSTRMKNVLAFLISSNQTAYVKNMFKIESGRVISDILEISNSLVLEVILEGFLITVGIEKAFDSVNHCFL